MDDMGRRERTATVVGRNVVMLAKRHSLDIQAVALRAGIGIRTIHHITAGRNTTIETADAVARVFGLTCWHLLNPELETDLENQEWVDRVRHVFGTAPAKGTDLVKDAIKAAETVTAIEQAKKSA
jgi:plasmid maintenance system antidote protein VapI